MNRNLSAFAIGLTLLTTVGCTAQVSGPGQSQSEEPTPTASQESTRTRTIVYLHADGKQTVKTTELAPRNEPVVSSGLEPQSCGLGVQCGVYQDTGCTDASLWLFDQPSSKGNELCVYTDYAQGYGASLDLNTVPRFIGGCHVCGLFEWCCVQYDWSSAIRSWSAGDESAEFDSPNASELFSWGDA